MKLGTSIRFLYPTGPHTYPQFKEIFDSLPPGAFFERPMGAEDTGQQARNVLELAATAHQAGLNGFLTGDQHALPASYANTFSPMPTLGRIMAVTGDMPVGVVLLAPFYEPVMLAEQLGTLAAFADAPLIVVLVNGGNPEPFRAYGFSMASRARRTEELAAVLRPLLDGESVSFEGSAAEVTERLVYFASLGFGEVMVRHISGDHAKILRSIELIGEQVIGAIADY